MKHVALVRLALGLLAPLAIAASACSDDGSNPTSVLAANKSTSGDTGTSGSGSKPPGDTATHGDTGKTPPPTYANLITIAVHVGSSTSTTDTLASAPVAGATATVFKIELVPTTGGPDTLTVVETKVGSGTTDANGDVSFAQLPSVLYRIQADGPAGSGLGSVSARIAPPYQATVRLPLILRRVP